MNCWKFVCKNDTEAECFQRALFGHPVHYLDQVKQIKRGDVLILYNVESDILFMPFRAESEGGWNLKRDAWGGRFPAQVKVSWESLIILRNASKRYPFLREKRIKLTPKEFSSLIENARPSRLPEDILEDLRRIDKEIHKLAHRIEEDLMSGKGHPADRIIDLEFHKAELLARMRDFVWAVRRLDRVTGLLKLPSSNSDLFKQ